VLWILGEVVLIGLGIMVILAARLGAFRIAARSQFVMVGDAAPSKNLATLVTGIAAAVMLFGSIGLTLFSSYHPIPAGQVAVVSEFGKIMGQIGEGPQFIAPWREATRVDIKVQRASFSNGAGGLGAIASASAETQNIFFNVTLNWQVSPDGVQNLMRTVGPDFFNVLVPTRVRQFFKTEVVKFNAVDATRLREEIRVAVSAALAEDLREFSINVVALQIDDISYETAFEQSIEAKQVASQDALRAQEVVAQREAEALQLEAQARGEAGAQIARAEGARQARILEAQAEAQSLILEGTAKAQANREIAASLTPALIQFEALKQLDGVQIALIPSGSNFLLDPSNILRTEP
jgi:regulator of protease activity HflC (stomatin/prohibitin superfamily)